MLGKAQFITVALLTERYFIINTEIISKQDFYCISVVSVCTPFEYRDRPVGLKQHNVSVTHL